MNELSKRLGVAIIGIPLALILIYFGSFPFFISILAISSITLFEYYSLAEKKGFFPHKWTGLSMTMFVQSVFFMQFSNIAKLSPFMTGILLFIAFVLITMMVALFSKQEHPLANTAVTVFGVAYVSIFFITLYILREFQQFLFLFENHLKLQGHFENNSLQTSLSIVPSVKWGYYILTIFSSIWLCDSAAYFFGKAFGKHKLYPRISPKKSVEGAVAGFIFAIITFVGLGYLLIPEMPWVHNLAGGIIVGVLGQIGDLAESMLKRDANVKDSSNILPGHGGLLDRFDSILFVAPSLFVYLCVVIYFNWTI